MSTKGKVYKAETYTPEQMSALMDCFDTESDTGIRDKALVSLLWGTGLRISEALALVPGDVGLEDGHIHIQHGKNDKQRLVYLDTMESERDELETPLELLNEWTQVREGMLEERGIIPRDAPVFCTRKGTTLKRQYTQRMLERHGEAIGIARLHAHGLRHTFSATQARAGTPINTVQSLLGHSSLETTSRYLAHVCDDDLIEAAGVMPRL